MKCLFWHETSSCNPRGKSTDAGRDEKPVGERMVGKPDYPVHFITQKLLTPDAPSALNSRSRPFHDSISATSDLGPVTRFSCCKERQNCCGARWVPSLRWRLPQTIRSRPRCTGDAEGNADCTVKTYRSIASETQIRSNNNNGQQLNIRMPIWVHFAVQVRDDHDQPDNH